MSDPHLSWWGEGRRWGEWGEGDLGWRRWGEGERRWNGEAEGKMPGNRWKSGIQQTLKKNQVPSGKRGSTNGSACAMGRRRALGGGGCPGVRVRQTRFSANHISSGATNQIFSCATNQICSCATNQISLITTNRRHYFKPKFFYIRRSGPQVEFSLIPHLNSSHSPIRAPEIANPPRHVFYKVTFLLIATTTNFSRKVSTQTNIDWVLLHSHFKV